MEKVKSKVVVFINEETLKDDTDDNMHYALLINFHIQREVTWMKARHSQDSVI